MADQKHDLTGEAEKLGSLSVTEVTPQDLKNRAIVPSFGLGIEGLDKDKHDVSVTPREDPKEGDHRRWMEKARFLFGTGLVTVVLGVAIYMTFGHSNADVQKAGAGMLVAIISAALGYVAGRAAK